MIKTQNRLNKYEYTQQVHQMDELSCNVRRESRIATNTSECHPRFGEIRSRERITRFPCPPLDENSFTRTYSLLRIKRINDIRTLVKEAVRAALRMPPRQSFPLGNMDMFLKENEREQLVEMFKVRFNHIGSSFILISREKAILSCYPLVRDLRTCGHICSNYKENRKQVSVDVSSWQCVCQQKIRTHSRLQ
jgi:hypothetical protein